MADDSFWHLPFEFVADLLFDGFDLFDPGLACGLWSRPSLFPPVPFYECGLDLESGNSERIVLDSGVPDRVVFAVAFFDPYFEYALGNHYAVFSSLPSDGDLDFAELLPFRSA